MPKIISNLPPMFVNCHTKEKFIIKHGSKKTAIAINVTMWLALLVTVIAVFVALSPNMPKEGADPSWMYGLNQATSQGLSFGRDIIFTFGPYASIYTQAYMPSTDGMMICGGLYLALTYWACLFFAMNDVQRRWVLIYCAALAGLLAYWKDTLFFSLPLLVGLATFKILFADNGSLAKSKSAPFKVALLFAPFGLLVLVKGSILILCGAIATLCSILFIANKRRLLSAICLFTPLVSMILCWVASGQSASDLPSYFYGMAPIVSGYTEAMALQGNPWEVALYLVAAITILRAISFQSHLALSSKVFLCSIYLFYLFISFKAGFVRHDHHAIIAGTAIMMAALLLPSICKTGIIFPAIFASFAWYYTNNNYVETSIASVGDNIKEKYSSAWHGAKNRLEINNWPRNEYDVAVKTLRDNWPFPALQGTTDIYSFNQAPLIASGYPWSPRPVFQSYSAYTPELAEANKRHLLGNKAPDNVIFRVEPIDGRFPSIEDGASWPLLLLNYQPTLLTENGFLFLRKQGNIEKTGEQFVLADEKHTLGENIVLPSSNQPIFAKIEIEPTIIGRLAEILYKSSELNITIELNNGIKKQYRLIAGMARSGFVISPLIENTTEFSMLYQNDRILNDKFVKSVTIETHGGEDIFWNDQYIISFSKIGTGT